MSKFGTCKFCGKKTQLVKSHIIPKFLFSDESNNKKMYSIDAEIGISKLYQAGVWDNILCEDCERKTSIYDKEFCNLTKLDFKKYIFSQDNKGILYKIPAKDYNYEHLRKFFISLILRASVSEKCEFRMIKLGKYEQIALNILNNVIDNDHLFKAILYKEPINKFSMGYNFLEKTKFDNQITYRICFHGFLIVIIVNYMSIRNKDKQLFESGCFNKFYMPILEMPEITNNKINNGINLYKEYLRKRKR